jgi:hypothetical protein
LPLGANRIEHLQQHRPQQHLERNRWSAQSGIEHAKSPDSVSRAVSITARKARSGCSSRIRCSRIDIGEQPRPLVRSRHRALDQSLIETITPRPPIPPTSSTPANSRPLLTAGNYPASKSRSKKNGFMLSCLVGSSVGA